ncbi:sulfate ABC transporter permease subunit CysW [candidate division KSB1 bacterium]|nr:sulfate ABC transporter permease subunit CysW [candidate division KSB1 bacterium]RQW06275.1 MAG: sulfate ABC transporter permease subunit CysW [candidate division KSB1 bacterium]
MLKSTALGTHPLTEPRLVRMLLLFAALLFLCLFLVLPIVVVFYNAFIEGLATYKAAIVDREALAAILLTLLAVAIAVPTNVAFGLIAAWAITKFRFPGKNLLISLIDMPLTVSPVISGTVFILLFGAQGLLGPWLSAHQVKIIFAAPGIVLATLFVTLPYVARELIPLMQSHGTADEEAAITLGASGWKTFFKITLPNIKWGLFYGLILSTARAIGEFGAVSVVSGHIRGVTITMPLQVEILYNEYNFAAAFAVASLLALLSLVVLGLKKFAQWQTSKIALEHEDYVFNREGE